MVWELLNTISLLKSEKIKDKTKLKKLMTTKKNCKNVNDKIFVSNNLELLKFLTEKKIKIKLKHNPKINE